MLFGPNQVGPSVGPLVVFLSTQTVFLHGSFSFPSAASHEQNASLQAFLTCTTPHGSFSKSPCNCSPGPTTCFTASKDHASPAHVSRFRFRQFPHTVPLSLSCMFCPSAYCTNNFDTPRQATFATCQPCDPAGFPSFFPTSAHVKAG